LSFYEAVGIGVRVGDLKIEELESEVLCTDSTALPHTTAARILKIHRNEECNICTVVVAVAAAVVV
jgi:hypothetical protein